MVTYVFLAGGGYGGYIWKEVASRLRARRHEVFTPTFTGLGERAHLASPQIDLDTHVHDIRPLSKPLLQVIDSCKKVQS
jgi:hypothetical protein